MDRIRLISTFIIVARARSFTVAAERLSISRASVTKQVAALEATLKVRLLHRSTHSVSLTEAGVFLLEAGDKLLLDFEEIESRVRTVVTSPEGMIRVGTPPSFGALHLIPAIQAFKAEHPDIQFLLVNDDGSLDIVRCGLDFSIRIAHSLRDSSSITRLLTRTPQVVVAAPSYLAQRGVPITPHDLPRHNCLIHAVKSPTGIWRFQHRGQTSEIHVSGSLWSNFGETILSAALLGEGISMHPNYMVHDDLSSGRLQKVLPDFVPPELEIRAVYARRTMPTRVSLFVSFLHRWLKRDSRGIGNKTEINSQRNERSFLAIRNTAT